MRWKIKEVMPNEGLAFAFSDRKLQQTKMLPL